MAELHNMSDTAKNKVDDLNLVWIDLEMSGLEIETRHILEIATIITDGQLNILAEGPDLVVHQPDEILDTMDDWNQSHHGESGLIEAVKKSKISVAKAEEETLEFISQWVPAGASPLCGNSIHNDRLFLKKFMPGLHDYLHYRNYDVSSVKEMVRRWYGEDLLPEKKGAHRALDDIVESIDELKYYRYVAFKDITADHDG